MKPKGKTTALRNMIALLALSLSAIVAAQGGYHYSEEDTTTPPIGVTAGPVRMAKDLLHTG